MRLIQVLSSLVTIFLVGPHSPVIVSGRTVQKRSNYDESLINPVSSQLHSEIAKPRVKRDRFPPVTARYQYYFHLYNVTQEKSPYGKCSVSLGYENNEGCLQGEVCVDQDTLTRVTCSLEVETACPPCASLEPGQPGPPSRKKRSGNLRLRRQGTGGGGTGGGGGSVVDPPVVDPGTGGGVTDECPRGCKPGEGCGATAVDGVCQDSKFPDDEYVDEPDISQEASPMVLFSGTAKHGEDCIVYGDRIDILQRSNVEFAEKSKILRTSEAITYFGSEICNWASAHTECIPDDPRVPETTVASKIYTKADIDERKRLAGTCKCMVALGDYAVTIQDEDKGYIICYIPANKGVHSACGHEIAIPYGEIESVRKDGKPVIRSTDPASKFCVPNAECRPGYEYVGLRCQCKPKARWNPKKFTCSIATRSGVHNSLFPFIVLLLSKVFSI